ncbi:MAG: alpha/beta fold hydrolase [Janthinobacterium lividum]
MLGAFAALSLVAASPAILAGPPAVLAEAHPGTLVRLPDGRHLNFRCAGTGTPTVILEGGFAATSLAWGRVGALVARTNRVCAYDRAGSGFSDPGPEPRDGAAIARDLDDGLRAAGIGGPLVVVGHSAGGLYVRLFANRRPREVVGMVLVDPSVEYQDRRLAAVFGPGTGSVTGLRVRAANCLAAAAAGTLPSADPAVARCVPADRTDMPAAVNAARRAEAMRPATWSTQVSELDALWTTTSAEVAAGRASYGAMPLIVLTAGDTYSATPPAARVAIDRVWAGLHDEVAARSTRGQRRTVAGSGHLMMRDRPDAVAAAIAEVAAAAHAGVS